MLIQGTFKSHCEHSEESQHGNDHCNTGEMFLSVLARVTKEGRVYKYPPAGYSSQGHGRIQTQFQHLVCLHVITKGCDLTVEMSPIGSWVTTHGLQLVALFDVVGET